MTPSPATPQQRSLGASARASLLWGGGFTLLRDVAQFGLMLILVRLLNPADYGTAAFVQSIIGFLAMISYSTFSLHALQISNPETIDWQTHFTAATAINLLIFGLVLLSAFGLTFTATYRDVALPLVALGIGFLVEIPATLRARMLEANHDWKRFRLQLMIGTLLGMGVGLTVALLGGGVWALILQPPMLGLPAAFDLLVLQRFRPQWTFSPAAWREAMGFGLNRAGSGLVGRLRQVVESVIFASLFDLAALGIFSRAMGLANLLAGRIGPTATSALYPVVTRAESGSPRFRRLSDLVFRGVCWTTVPIAFFLLGAAEDIVRLLYGSKWDAVGPLLERAAVMVSLVGISNALSSLLLANDGTRAVLWLDVCASIMATTIAVGTLHLGAKIYLIGLSLQTVVFIGVTVALLVRLHGVTWRGIRVAIIPTLAASALAFGITQEGHWLLKSSPYTGARILSDTLIFAFSYLLALRLMSPGPMSQLLEVAPGGDRIARVLRLTPI